MNPLDINAFSFELDFVSNPDFGKIQVAEAVKFDGSTYTVKQEDKRFARDISFMNDDIELFFYKGVYDIASNPLMLPNGVIVYNITQGFEFLQETDKAEGFEAIVLFNIKKSGINFTAGNLDFEGRNTDGATFFSFKVTQNTEKQIIKRKQDIVIDMFSDKDLKGNPIAPLETVNLLLKSKPNTSTSKWESYLGAEGLTSYTFVSNAPIKSRKAVNTAQNIINSGLKDTLSYLSNEFSLTNDTGDNLTGENFVFLEAINDLNNIKINFKNINAIISQTITSNINKFISQATSYVNLLVKVGDSFDSIDTTYEVFRQDFTYETSQGFNYTESVNAPSELTLDIDFIPRDKRVYIYFSNDSDVGFVIGGVIGVNNPNHITKILLNTIEVSIKATATGIDSVIKASRYIDIFKQTVKSISGLPVVAPRFDVGGEFYDQFGFSGKMIRRFNDKPFNVKLKDLGNTLMEFAADYQIIDGAVYIGIFEDFYPNKEIAVFDSRPDKISTNNYNSRFSVNEINLGYKKFEEDKDEENTIDAVHTESQWTPPNDQVENDKTLEFNQIRDPYKIQFFLDRSINKTTSLSGDDDFFMLDVINLAPNIVKTLSVFLLHQTSGNELKLLNDNSFEWGQLGFIVGSTLVIENTGNAGSYTVTEITNTILTLTGSPSFNSEGVITKFNYTLADVLYTNRTNEGFELIDNLLDSDKFSNLLYTIKRSLKRWYGYIATMCQHSKTNILRNTEFKNNGELTTRFIGETENTIENADVNIEDLGQGVLTTMEHKVKMQADWEGVVNLLNALNTVNEDGTIGGFIRTFDNVGEVIKGYPKELEYEPYTETLTATLEERNESDFLTILTDGDIIIINETGYNETQLYEQWYEFNNDFLIIFDINNKPIINPTRFDKVELNGVVYDDAVLLGGALALL